MTDADIERKRKQLAEVDATLARLRAQYDLLMNAFKFDEARALVAPIEAAESERKLLVEMLPPAPASAPMPYSVARSRRRR